MPTYSKIHSPFTRDEKTHVWNVGDWTSAELATLQSCAWEWTEKMDGTNVRVGWDGERVMVGGRTDNAQMPPRLFEWINATFTPEKMRAVFEDCSPERVAVVYGEGIGSKIQKSGGLYGDPRVVSFDVRIGGVWCKRETVEKVASDLGVGVAPVVFRGTITDAIEFVGAGLQSVVATQPLAAEGIVGRLNPELLDRFGSRIIVKVKAEDVRRIRQ